MLLTALRSIISATAGCPVLCWANGNKADFGRKKW
jgi:hypothetical protein